MDSSSNYVRGSLLKLLTIVVGGGQNGFDTVMNALDHVKVLTGTDLRAPVTLRVELCRMTPPNVVPTGLPFHLHTIFSAPLWLRCNNAFATKTCLGG